MSNIEFNAAPELSMPDVADDKWRREFLAFQRLLPSLMEQYPNKFVAIHEERVVGSGEDQIEVALEAYRQHGYVPIYVGQVIDKPVTPVRIPSARNPRSNGIQ